ncbi:unnamed protein product [Trichobilharzia szidati]|nr:unnamed protein product [Trichobilharzia szidati]
MLKLTCIVIALLGCFDLNPKNLVHGGVVEVSNTDKHVQNGIVCKMCMSAANMTLGILREEFLWRAFFKIMSPTCYLMPDESYRELCDYLLSGELARMVTIQLNQINAATLCDAISVCGKSDRFHGTYENDEQLKMHFNTFIHEKIDEICTNYATDINHCAEPLKKISSNLFNHFIEYINEDGVNDMQ